MGFSIYSIRSVDFPYENWGLHCTQYCLDSSWDKYLNMKVKTIKCLEDSIMWYRCFLYTWHESSNQKRINTDKLTYIKTLYWTVIKRILKWGTNKGSDL